MALLFKASTSVVAKAAARRPAAVARSSKAETAGKAEVVECE